MKGNLNEKIRQFINDMPDDYNFSRDDAKYISRYTGCEVPPFVFNTLIQGLVKEDYPFINVTSTTESANALCYGYGSLSVLSNTNAIIKSYQEDYYCYRVTQAVHYDRVVTGEQSVTFRNLADYFMNYKGNNFKYNIVVLFPHLTDYHTIDSDPNFSGLSSYAYYTLRGAFFLKDKGVLYSLVPKQYADEIKSNQNLILEVLKVNLSIMYEGEYAIIKIQK